MGDPLQVFVSYADFYDAIYQDKDYEVECDFIERLFAEHARGNVRSILDLGCGTGGHTIPLARRGYAMTGVDISQGMLDKARVKAEEAGVGLAWHRGDVRDFDLGATFDAVLFMFAVIAYQETNTDLAAALRAARRHLEPGGLLIFDTWYGPAVLVDPPGDRVKTVNGVAEDSRVIRFTRSVHNKLKQTVEVHFYLLHLMGNQVEAEVRESHVMRYLFPQEVSFHLEQAGFKLVKLCPLLRPDAEMSDGDWYLTVVAEAV